MYGVPVYEYIECITVVLPSNLSAGIVVEFSDNQILNQRDVYITSVECFDRSTIVVANGSPVITADGAANIAVTLMDMAGTNRISNMPYKNLNPGFNYGISRDLKPFQINISKCSITLVSTAGLSVGEAIYIAFGYKKRN